MKLFNIIGDIHGRPYWRKLVKDNRINIFVGDYFDPYDDYSFEELKDNFLSIIEFVKTTPDTILLMGNHDIHYLTIPDGSRYDSIHAAEIRQLFLDNIHLFNGVAYAINEDVLVSHAGATKEWLEKTGYYNVDYPRNAIGIADWINNTFWDGFTDTSNGALGWDMTSHCLIKEFLFSRSDYWDVYGTSPDQSPAWVRPQTLADHTALPDGVQIVGHTQVNNIIPDIHPRIIMVDCLGTNPASLMVDVDDNVKYNVNKYEP